MPMIDVYHPEGAFTPEAQARLGEALTALLLKMEGAPDNPVSRTISWAFFHPLPAGAIFVGGKPAADKIYKIVFSVPQGTAKLHGPATLDQRDALVKAATALVLAAEGSEPRPPIRRASGRSCTKCRRRPGAAKAGLSASATSRPSSPRPRRRRRANWPPPEPDRRPPDGAGGGSAYFFKRIAMKPPVVRPRWTNSSSASRPCAFACATA